MENSPTTMGNTQGLVLTTPHSSLIPSVFPTSNLVFSSGSLFSTREITAQNKGRMSYPDINTLNISFL
jgi:hypothetical protein